MTTTEHISRLLQQQRLTHTKLADQTGVLLLLDGLEVLSLNETAMFLIESMKAGATTEAALAERLVREFEVDVATAAKDVAAFVADLGSRVATA